jgi:hypothetical protein
MAENTSYYEKIYESRPDGDYWKYYLDLEIPDLDDDKKKLFESLDVNKCLPSKCPANMVLSLNGHCDFCPDGMPVSLDGKHCGCPLGSIPSADKKTCACPADSNISADG